MLINLLSWAAATHIPRSNRNILSQIIPSGSGVHKHPLFFLKWFRRRGADHASPPPALASHPVQAAGGSSGGQHVALGLDGADVRTEAELVGRLAEDGGGYAIVARDLQKFFPARGGRPGFLACKGLNLAIPRGECFGMLGPNGAGKSTSINMLVGFLTPTAGTAVVEGLDIRSSASWKAYLCLVVVVGEGGDGGDGGMGGVRVGGRK